MSHRKSAVHETTDSLTYVVSQFSSPSTPRKLLSDKKRDTVNPDVLWRLKVYPNGNGTPGFLALYIDIPSKHSLPHDWSCAREVTFTLHHPTDPSKSIHKRTSHTFNEEEPDWGYNQIIPVAALEQRGFLQNDTIKVSATFKPAELDPADAERLRTSAAGIASVQPHSPATPELTTPRSPSLSNATFHEFNEREDCRVVIEGFSKTGCEPHACDWRPFTEDPKYEWRLVVYPHASADAIGAYIDARAKNVTDDKWLLHVSAAILLNNVETPSISVGHSFCKVFKAQKPRKGFPILSLSHILSRDGFIANDKLCVNATARLLPEPTEKPKKLPTVVDSILMPVHGFLSYDGSTPDSCKIVSPWHKLEGLGRWRCTIYPAGTKNNKGFVSAVVAFQPSEEWTNSNSDWQIRALFEASAVRKGGDGAKEEGDACMVLLDAQHLKASLERVIPMQKVVDEKESYLKWDPDFEDDDTLRVNVSFRTCESSGPKTFVSEQAVDVCVKNVETGIAQIKAALAKINKPLLEEASQSSLACNSDMKELEKVFKQQMELLAAVGSDLEYKDKMEALNRKLAALKEEEEACTGKGCAVEELNAKEQEMRSTLKKLLVMQGGAKPGEDKTKEQKEAPAKRKPEKPLELQKPSVAPSELMTRNAALVCNLCSLVEQCQRVEALSSKLCSIREGLEKYMTLVQQWIAEQEKKHEEFVKQEQELQAKCQEAERRNKVLRGDDEVLKTLSAEEVAKFTDFVMEAVGQVAVAKYLTKK